MYDTADRQGVKGMEERIQPLNERNRTEGPVLYWMERDQRAEDNWALTVASKMAVESRASLVVAVTPAVGLYGGTQRHAWFLLTGLAETERTLRERNISMVCPPGDPAKAVVDLARSLGAGQLVTDFNPLRLKQAMNQAVAAMLEIPMLEVDAHNVVPCRVVSGKAEYGAYTLRPKIHRQLPRFLRQLPPPLSRHPFGDADRYPLIDWKRVAAGLGADESVGPVEGVEPGSAAAQARLEDFLRSGLPHYAERRNDPGLSGQSGLSPYLHFGQLSAQRVAAEAVLAGASAESFLEELIVRRELSDNFCLNNPVYDQVAGFPAWAQETLSRHSGDRREVLYSAEALEGAATHDPYWNAAQRQLVSEGRMHGYMRMYWAKKLLEWSPDAETALKVAIRLNDRYALDGTDPNGYAGIAWSIGGVHDRPWSERQIFGKIRYMNAAGLKRKFDMTPYLQRFAAHGRSELLF